MLLFVALLLGCTETETLTFDQCEVQASLQPAEALPGDEVVLTGGPFTEPYDTVVQVDGVDGEVLMVERTDCERCDDCLVDWDCGPCMSCEHDCDDLCADCVETTSFTVPEVEVGARWVVLTNRYGSTPSMALEVLESQE